MYTVQVEEYENNIKGETDKKICLQVLFITHFIFFYIYLYKVVSTKLNI